MSEEQAALAFAQSKPTEWEAFKATWIKNNAPIVESLLVDPPVEEIPTVEGSPTITTAMVEDAAINIADCGCIAIEKPKRKRNYPKPVEEVIVNEPE